MHNNILCVSTNPDDCPIEFEDVNADEFGADYFEDNKPEEIDSFIVKNFGSCVAFVPSDKPEEEIENHCEGSLLIYKNAVRTRINKWLYDLKQRIEESTTDTILEDGCGTGSRYNLRKAFGTAFCCDVVCFNYEIFHPIEFLIKAYNIKEPLYIVGCVDYHW